MVELRGELDVYTVPVLLGRVGTLIAQETPPYRAGGLPGDVL